MLFASDLDHGRNAKINYRLQSASETFHVERDTGALVVSSTIDRESVSTYILTVICLILQYFYFCEAFNFNIQPSVSWTSEIGAEIETKLFPESHFIIIYHLDFQTCISSRLVDTYVHTYVHLPHFVFTNFYRGISKIKFTSSIWIGCMQCLGMNRVPQ